MAQATIGIGSSANDGTGDSLRTAGGKINTNFTELYAAAAQISVTAGKILSASNTITLAAGADSTTQTFPAVSSTLAGIGVAQTWSAAQTHTAPITLTGTTINKLTLTAPASGATLTIADGKTLTVNQTITLTGTAGQTFTFPAATDTVGCLGTVQTWSAAQTFSSNVISTKSITAAANQGAFAVGTLPYTGIDCGMSVNAGVDNYTQIIVSNSNATATASANVIVSNDAGTDTTNYGAFGINSTVFSAAGVLNAPGYTYLSCISNDLAIGTQDAHAVHFGAGSAWTADAITISATNVPSIFNGNFMSAAPVNGQLFQVQSLTELTTIANAATTTTTIQLPAAAIILGVSTYVQTAIPTATTFTVGDSGSATRYSTAAVSVNLGSSDKGTAAGAYYNATAKGVLITPNGTPATNAGRLRVTIHYISVTAPTS